MNLKHLKVITIVYSILLMLIGTIHSLATFGVYQKWLEIMPPERAIKGAYFFAIMGIALVFAGITNLYKSRKIFDNTKDSLSTILIQLGFVLLATVGATFFDMRGKLNLILIAGASINFIFVLYSRFKLNTRIKI